MDFSNIKNLYGFTIIELLIWLVIFGVLTGGMVANFRTGERNDAVRHSAELIASTLRAVQTKTLTGVALPDGDFPDGGYGARFDSAADSAIIIFADTSIPSNFSYDAGEEVEGIIKLPGSARFSWAENFSALDIVFSAPDGKIYFNGDTATGKVTINVSSAGSDLQKQVEVLRLSGQIRTQ